MPQINLLTSIISKKTKKAGIPETRRIELKRISKILVPLSVVAISLMLSLWLIIGLQVATQNRILRTMLEKEKKIAVDPQELVKLKDTKEGLQERFSFIEGLLFTKFFWSEKLEEIEEVIPFGVWLTKVSLEKRRRKLESSTDESKETYQVLLIEGKAVAPKIQDAIELIGRFNTLLKEDKTFSKDFLDIELKSASKDSIAKTDVMSFEFMCALK